jgi:N-acetylmuramoyl-L-alanine amidase
VIDYPSETNAKDLASTVRAINSGGYALSVSLHCDASDNKTAKGAHCIYVSEAGRCCAEAIAKHLCPIMPGRANRTVKRGNLYVLNNTDCPAVLVECGFVTNTRDADMLRHEGHRIAMAIGSGILDYFFNV